MEKSTIAHETINQETNNQEDNMTENNKQIINKENNMIENHEQETLNQETTNQEDTMPETNTTTTNIANEELTNIYTAIKKDYAGLASNEKSSAAKSYSIGHNLILLHTGNQYQQLSDRHGNPFKSWGDFCELGCEFTRAYADKLMKSAAIQDELEQAGVTTRKQSVANLYALHKAKKNDPDLNLADVWKKASDNAKKAFPSRKKVQEAIDSESHATKKINPVKKSSNATHDLTSLLTAIKAITLSKEDLQTVRQVLDELLKSETADDSSEQAGQEGSPDTTLEAEPVKLSA